MVRPRILCAELSEEEDFLLVGQDSLRLNLLGQKNGVVEEPGEEWERPSADVTAQSGSGQRGLSAVQIVHFHSHVRPDRDWRHS